MARKAPAKPAMKSWIVKMRYEYEGEVIVDATDAAHALVVAKAETPEMEPVPELVNWETRGTARENT